MKLIEELFDVSPLSLVIGIIVFVVVFLTTRYFLNIKSREADGSYDTRATIGYSVLAGILSALFVLVVYKKSLVYMGSITYMDEPFDKA